MIVTVTVNAALDRTLTVPIFQIGFRHRSSEVVALAGGKGINVARALKILEVPVVATGLAGGRTGTRIIEELTSEAILNDFVRIAAESRTSTAVVDPTSGTYTEINEWGPEVVQAELDTLARTSSVEDANTQEGGPWSIRLEPLHEVYTDGYGNTLYILLGAISFVLLIAAVNVANLQLSRGVTRHAEMTTRANWRWA